VRLTFLGADRGVTGSCHMVECAGKRLLVDCGYFQGGGDTDEENAQPFAFDPAAIDYLLLTHAHLDHCGRLPLLVKRGFRGEVIATRASRELARLVMLDAARLNEEEAERRARHRRRGEGREDGEEPLYSLVDAVAALDTFGRTARYDEPLVVAPGITATFFDAGHILGSASILLELGEGETRRRVVFSGDIGNAGRPLLNAPVPPPKADAVVMETTYGDRKHRSFALSVEEFYAAIEDTFRRGGNVIVPTFALERAQELLFYLHLAMVDNGRLSPAIQVFLDSPMAINATAIYRRHSECLSDEARALFVEGEDPLSVPGLHITCDSSESRAINLVKGGAIILAGSGMASGGRVVHHLRHNLWRSGAGVIFVGFAASGTLARRIIDGASSVRIFGEDVPVKARAYTINGFSAHADQSELVAWHKSAQAPRTFLVHGEERAMQALAPLLKDTEVIMPRYGESVEL
jgi:metallo-beta-lactamase family protein